MKLLFDHNLSHRLVDRLSGLFPGSTQTRLLSMERASDLAVWDFAGQNGFAIVTLDKDFSDLALLRGFPPKIVWLRCGNSTVLEVEHLLRVNAAGIEAFAADAEMSVIEIWP